MIVREVTVRNRAGVHTRPASMIVREAARFTSEFFIRKAMGWALRQYAKTDPDWVRGWIAEQHTVMSQLAVREALKHLGPLPQPPSQD